MESYKYLFRPVPSPRFGRSLGINLTPSKICTQDCIFCQLGGTMKKTLHRRAYVPTVEVLLELETWLKMDGNADYITVGGGGEAALHSQLGEVLKFVRTSCSVPAVLLTNGSMFWIPEVRGAASYANVVKLCLSAWDESSFRRLHRPHVELKFEQVLEGQKAFRKRFKGQIWMEIFLIPEMNATPAHSRKIAALAKKIKPDRIHFNVAAGPACADQTPSLTEKELACLGHYFEPGPEVIQDCPNLVLKQMAD